MTSIDIITTTWKKSDGTTVTKLDYNTEYTANVEIFLKILTKERQLHEKHYLCTLWKQKP